MMDPTSLVIDQDGFRPAFPDLVAKGEPQIPDELADVHSVDVRAVADLWDSYLHVLVAADEAGMPAFASIGRIDPKAAINVGQGGPGHPRAQSPLQVRRLPPPRPPEPAARGGKPAGHRATAQDHRGEAIAHRRPYPSIDPGDERALAEIYEKAVRDFADGGSTATDTTGSSSSTA